MDKLLENLDPDLAKHLKNLSKKYKTSLEVLVAGWNKVKQNNSAWPNSQINTLTANGVCVWNPFLDETYAVSYVDPFTTYGEPFMRWLLN